MTIKERKERIIEQIHQTDDETLLTQLENVIEFESDKSAGLLKELLKLSSQQTRLTKHTSSKDLIR